MTDQKRNEGIEIMRFIFSILILLGHSASSFLGGGEHRFALGKQGAIGVEFFFILSGILMAKTCDRNMQAEGQKLTYKELGDETISFLKKKYFSIYPTHIITFIIMFMEYVCISNISVINAAKVLVYALPEIFLFHMNGLRMENINPNDWYISAMLIAMLFLYPLLKKYGTLFSKVLAPIITLVILGYCYLTTGSMTPSDTTLLGGLAIKGTLRAIAEISLGTIVYEALKYINKISFKKRGIWLLRLIESFCYLSTIAVSSTDSDAKWYFPFIFVLAAGLLITFSKYSIFAGLKHSNIILYLGNLSMTIFVCQRIILYPLQKLHCFEGYLLNTVVFFIGTIILSIIMKMIIDKLVENKNFWKNIFIN